MGQRRARAWRADARHGAARRSNLEHSTATIPVDYRYVAAAAAATGCFLLYRRFTMATHRRLSLFDSAMAAGGNELVTGTPTVISAAIYFEALPSRAKLERLVREKILPLDVFAGRPEGCPNRWKPVASFDITRHLLSHEVNGEADLDFFINSNCAEPLLNKEEGPWWEIHAVSTREPGARELLFFRVEHACADGIALLQLFSRISTTKDGQPLPMAEYSRPPRPKPNPCALLCDFLKSFLKYAALPLGTFDTQLPLHPPLKQRQAGLHFSSQRRLVFVPKHSLASIRAIKAAAGTATTVNDVVYAAFAGALRRHCLALAATDGGAAAAAFTSTLDGDASVVRALVPLAFPRSVASPLTNDWTFLSVDMPVGVAERTERIEATHETFATIKGSAEALAARLAVQINSLSPPRLLGTVAQQLFSRHTVVFSNVPGPADDVYVCGEKVTGVYSAFPNLILQVLTLSYAGDMYMSIACDDRLPEPHKLAELYLDELRQLGVAYGVQSAVVLPPMPPPPPSPPSAAGRYVPPNAPAAKKDSAELV